MGFRRYALQLVTSVLGFDAQATTRALAAVFDEKSGDGPENASIYRRMGTRKRDIDSAEHGRSIEDGVKCWQRDGYAARVVNVMKFYAVGSDPIRATAKAEDDADREAVQTAIDAVWKDVRNRLERGVLEFYDAASATGELLLVLGVGAESALTRVGYVDPADIECVLLDPDDARQAIGVVRKPAMFRPERLVHPVPDSRGEFHPALRASPADASKPLAEGTLWRVPAQDGTARYSAKIGQPALYLGLNKLPNQSRGTSDLYRVFHVLEMLDSNLWRFAERMGNLLAFAWAIKHPPGATQDEKDDVLEIARDSLTRGAGGVFLYPSSMEVSAEAPSLNAADWRDSYALLVNALATMSNVPPHLLTGEGGDVNLATAGELAAPFIAAVKTRQADVRSFFSTLLLVSILQRPEIRAMYEDDPERVQFDLSFPEVTGKDAVRAITVLQGQTAVLNVLRSSFGLKPDAAIREVCAAANEYGLELTPKDFDEASLAATFRTEPFPKDPGAQDPSGGAGGEDPQAKQQRQDGATAKPNGQTTDERGDGGASG